MPQRPRTVTQGKIGPNQTSREVLWSVLKSKNVNSGVLRITSSDGQGLDGELGISRGVFVTGGLLRNQPGNGYEAVKSLLCVKNGQFQYFDHGDDFFSTHDQGLKIRLTTLISVLPNLPENAGELTGGTLNRIRAMAPTEVAPSEETMIDNSVLAQLRAWEQRSMRLRAAALWGTFVALSCIAGLLYWFHH